MSKIDDKFLALWSGSTVMATRRELRDLLMDTGGNIMRNGRLEEVKSKHLGAGAYKVWTQSPKEDEA